MPVAGIPPAPMSYLLVTDDQMSEISNAVI